MAHTLTDQRRLGIAQIRLDCRAWLDDCALGDNWFLLRFQIHSFVGLFRHALVCLTYSIVGESKRLAYEHFYLKISTLLVCDNVWVNRRRFCLIVRGQSIFLCRQLRQLTLSISLAKLACLELDWISQSRRKNGQELRFALLLIRFDGSLNSSNHRVRRSVV